MYCFLMAQYTHEHVLKRSFVSKFLKVKVDKCGKNKHDAISRKLSKAQQKVWGKLNWWNGFFISALLSLGFNWGIILFEQQFKMWHTA